MNTLLLIFLAPFLTSTAVGQVESVQTQAPFLQTAALKFYCRYGSVLNEDVSGCTPKAVVQEQPQPQQTVQEKVVEVVRNVFVPVASAQEPSDSYLESMIRRIVLELLPQPQVITVKGEKGDKGDKGDPGVSGSNLQAFDGIQMPFWNGYGAGPVTGGGSTVINNVTNVFGSSSTSSMTADNGLTINPANNVQLGGTLIQDTNLDLATRTLTLNQTSTSSRFKIQGASGYGSGFSTQDLIQIETYPNEGFAISSFETGPLVTDSHGTFLNFSSNLANPLFDPLGAYIYSDRTTGAIGMGRFAGGSVFLDASGLDLVSEDAITSIAGSVQGFFANDNNLLVPGDAGFRFRTSNASSNDIAVANFDPGVGLGVNMFVGQFDPNTQFTGDPGDFYFNMSPVDDDDVLWVKGPSGGFGTSVGWVPVQAGTSSPTTAWLINGNGGTDPNINFVGTTDGQDLVLRTNNIEVARFGLANNFSFGYGAQALSSNMNVMGNDAGVGANNAQNSNFFGLNAGASAINASLSNFIGFYAGSNATNAATSNFIGASAGNGATNATESNFIGDSAGFNATDATFSNFIGYRAGFVSANASNSNFIGNEAGNGATDASNSNFFGQMAGLGAVNAQASNFIGFRSGLNATDAYRSNFFGYFAGQGALNANNSNFFGESAGQDATNANNSNFFGTSAGQNAATADNSNFFGNGAGLGAVDAFNSNFFGQESGYLASNAPNSNFFGHSAGYQATNADASNFLGQDAGYQATNANDSNFFGNRAGESAINAANSIFIGRQAGLNDTVNNTVSGTSILIGNNTNTGGFSNSIALGEGAVNTATNQLYVRDAITNFNLAGVNYVFPTIQGATGTILVNNGTGNLSWSATTSLGFLNHWQKSTNILSPNDAAVYQIGITNNLANTLTGFKTTNTNDVSNYAGAVVELKGSGADFTNNVYFGKYGASFYIPSWAGNGVLATDKSLVLGAVSTTSRINFQVAGGYIAPVTRMYMDNIGLQLEDGFNLRALGNTTLGNFSTDTVHFNAHVNSNINPATTLTFNLGGSTQQWNKLWVGSVNLTNDLSVNSNPGATGTLLMSQGAGLAPVWTATSSLNLSVASSSIASNFGFIQNGNLFGTAAVLGTNDSQALNFETNNTNRLSISNAGGITISNDSTAPHFGNVLTIQNTAGSHQNRIRFQGATESVLFGQTISYPRGISLFSETTSLELFRVDGNIYNSPVAPYGYNMLIGNSSSDEVRFTFSAQAQTMRLISDATYRFALFEQSPSNSYLFTVNSSGHLAVGNISATHRLTVEDTSTTDVARFNGSGGTQCTVVTGTGWTCTSDKRLKENIETIENASNIISGLRAVSYNWKDKENTQYGFIAQEVSQLLPELVTQNSDGYLSLNTSGLIPFIIKSQQEQIEEIKIIKQQLSAIEISDNNSDIETIDPIESLTKLLAIEVKSYQVNANTSTSTKQTGFLIQQIETQFPGLVLTSIEGTKTISYAGMTAVLAQAIQTLYGFMTDIGVTIEGGVAKVGEFIARKVKTDELCIGNVCVTESQFLQMVQSAQVAPNPGVIESSNNSVTENGDGSASTTPTVSNDTETGGQVDENNMSLPSETPPGSESSTFDAEPLMDVVSDIVPSTDSVIQ